MPGCITSDYKDVLVNLIKAEVGEAVLHTVVESIPLCSPTQTSGKPVIVKPERAIAEKWPDAEYHAKDGSMKEGSFSGLFKEVYGTPVTEDLICRWWGDKQECRSPSTVENFRNRGDIVKGNGDPAPIPTADMSAGQVERLFKDWKNELLTSGKKIHIYNPEAPEIKEATKAVEKKSKKA